MKLRPSVIGLLQAVGLAVYISLFISVISFVGPIEHTVEPFAMMGIVLTLFVLSALVCGTITLMYPLMTFLDGKRKEAVQMVLFTIFFLALLCAGWVTIAINNLSVS